MKLFSTGENECEAGCVEETNRLLGSRRRVLGYSASKKLKVTNNVAVYGGRGRTMLPRWCPVGQGGGKKAV